MNSIESSIEGLRLTLLASAARQKMIRSGVFWKRFRFARRTSDRIETVRAALVDRHIDVDLDFELFGREPRDEKIVFSLAANGDNRLHTKPKSDQGELILEQLGAIEPKIHSEAEVFSILFVHLFCTDSPNYPLSSGDFGATTSGWTYHTAGAIAQACKILGFTCKFESGGKRDALIESRDDEPEVLIGAEWEWNYHDIFGPAKELEKLRDTCINHETSHAFLLTYCPENVYSEFIISVVRKWQEYFSDNTIPPSLFLHTIEFEPTKNVRQFRCLKTIVVSGREIEKWRDKNIL